MLLKLLVKAQTYTKLGIFLYFQEKRKITETGSTHTTQQKKREFLEAKECVWVEQADYINS